MKKLFAALLLLLLVIQSQAFARDTYALNNPIQVNPQTSADTCLECHAQKGFRVPINGNVENGYRKLHFESEAFLGSAHGDQTCTACHTDITQMPHREKKNRMVDCVSCHEDTAKRMTSVDKTNDAEKDQKLQKVLSNVGHYMASIHAQPSKDNPDRPNATCVDCHNAHEVYPMESAKGKDFRQVSPTTCGKCHDEVLDEYKVSLHGVSVMRFGKDEAAVCTDCHSAHSIGTTEEDPALLAITQNCGECHKEEAYTYKQTYHGQVATLGETHTAKCFNCHSHHKTREVDDPRSMAHKDNRLATCNECHEDAGEGFIEFHPHGNTNDFDRFPFMYVVSKFMIGLLLGVFAFFWTHSALWFYREYKDKKDGVHHVFVDDDGEAVHQRGEHNVYVRRFSWQWRVAHLALSVAVILLVLTGTAALYAESFWAPTVMKWIGGTEIAAILHRIAAATFGGVFFGHVAVIMYKLLIKHRGEFRWFGPYSLLPRWQDGHDLWAMTKWFFGQGPRPVFDHWTYFEKFDYWAPFWGMFIIGVSGLMLAFPEFTGTILPGWVFNVATIVHGEEAFLAAVFLFTVHYFNCHFRPDKFPQDIVMFTGAMPLEEFIEERKVEYDRLVKEGKLDEILVDPPSDRATLYSKILGGTLIIVSLVLLVLVLTGFVQHMFM